MRCGEFQYDRISRNRHCCCYRHCCCHFNFSSQFQQLVQFQLVLKHDANSGMENWKRETGNLKPTNQPTNQPTMATESSPVDLKTISDVELMNMVFRAHDNFRQLTLVWTRMELNSQSLMTLASTKHCQDELATITALERAADDFWRSSVEPSSDECHILDAECKRRQRGIKSCQLF